MLQQITVFDDGASLSPVKLTRGDRNQLRFLVNRPDINPAVLIRPYAAITRLGRLLALTMQNITFAVQTDGLLAVELDQLELNTAEIQKFTLDYRPDTAKPDIDGEFTFCRANLEIGAFDTPSDGETCLLLNIPVEIHCRNYISGEPAPAPKESFYTKTETDQKIAEAVAEAVKNCHEKMETVFGTYLTQYEEVLNGKFL